MFTVTVVGLLLGIIVLPVHISCLEPENWQDREFVECCRKHAVPNPNVTCLYRAFPDVASRTSFAEFADYWACYSQNRDVGDCCKQEEIVACLDACNGAQAPSLPISEKCLSDANEMMAFTYCFRKTRRPANASVALECSVTKTEVVCDDKADNSTEGGNSTCVEFVRCEPSQ